MRFKLFASLLLGIVGYLLVITITLFFHYPLSKVLLLGLIAFVLLAAGGFTLLVMMEVLSKKDNTDGLGKSIATHDGANKENRKNKENQAENEKKEKDSREDFTPLNPPILETKEASEE